MIGALLGSLSRLVACGGADGKAARRLASYDPCCAGLVAQVLLAPKRECRPVARSRLPGCPLIGYSAVGRNRFVAPFRTKRQQDGAMRSAYSTLRSRSTRW